MIKKTENNDFMSPNSINNESLKNFLESKMTLEENIRFSENEPELIQILSETKKMQVPEIRNKEEIWNEISDKMHKHDKKHTILTTSVKRVFYAAASILIIVGLYFIFSSDNTKINISKGNHLTIYLPDSSEVALNAETEIEFDKKSWEKQRIVHLSGEAFFHVKKGSRFTVVTKNGSVEVLGTSFNVFSRNEIFSAECYTGKVKVFNKTTDEIITPNEGVKLTNNKKLQKYYFVEKQNSDWQKGEFYFESADLKIVFDEIQRQFDVKISLPDLKGRKYTGFFTNKNLDQALQNVCIPMKLNFNFDKNKIFVTNK